MKHSKPIRVGGVPEHFNLPWHMASESGAFRDAGLSVKYQDFGGGTGAMTRALREKEIDAAVLLTEGACNDILNGGENRLVKVYASSPLIWGIHVAADSPISSVEDIQGKRYAISRKGSGSHLIAIVDASIRGWDTADIKFEITKNLEGARSALADNTADVFFWERFMTQPLVDRGEFRRVAVREVPWPSFVVSVRKEILDERADEIRTMLEEVQSQATALVENENAVETIANRYDLKQDDTHQWFSHVKWHDSFDPPKESLETVVEYLEKLDLIPQDSNPESVWSNV